MAVPLTVLIVEDNEGDAQLIAVALEKAGFGVKWERVETEAGFLAHLHEGLDLVLSDYHLPSFGGFLALDLFKKQGLEIPFILVSGRIGEERAVEAMKLGATDYVPKDRLVRLGAAVTRALAESRSRREHRRAEEALRLFRALIDQSNDVLEIIDPATGRFLDASAKGPAELGFTREELLALRVFDIDPTIAESSWPERMEKLRQAGSFSGEGIHRRKDGSTFPIEFNAKWVRVGRDYIVSVVRDISESRKLREQLLRSQRVEAVGMLAGGIAHDLNNILAPVVMGAGILIDRLPDSKDRELVGIIQASARRGSGIIRQLLTFSRGIAGESGSIQLRHILAEMADIVRETFPRNITFEKHTARDLRPVAGDATQLLQVIMNLCVNARDAMPGGGTLVLSAQNVELTAADVEKNPPAKPGPHVALKVKDTGQGIEPGHLARIFEPFFSTKPPNKGSGLGLSTVLGIVRDHEGFVTVESRPGRGAAFTVFLPVALDGSSTDEVPDAARPPDGRGELILVVDDEAPIRVATRQLLEHNGYRVLAAGNGTEAFSMFLRNRDSVRVVLTDLMMPVMGGLTLIRTLRAMDPRLRVVAMSGLTDTASHAEIAAAGVDGVVEKPCDPGKVLGAIRKLLAGG